MKVVRYTGAGCATPRTLYRYHAGRPTIAPPPGYGVTQLGAVARNLSPRWPGRELRLREFYVDGDDPLCCPTLARTTLLGYDRGSGRYVPYRTRVYDPDWVD